MHPGNSGTSAMNTWSSLLQYPRAEVRYLPESAIADVPEGGGGIASGQILRVRPGAFEARNPQGTERVLPRQGSGGRKPSRDRSQREQDRRAEGGLAEPVAGREKAVRCGRAVLSGLGDAGLPVPADDGDAGRERLRVPGHHQTVEPLFGIIKAVLGFAGFSLRGLEKVEGEWTLVALAYNCKRLHKLSLAV